MREPLKFKSPNTVLENNISFTCSDSAVNTVFTILAELQMMGELGMTREVVIDGRAYCFDGDGADRLGFIKVNGLSIKEWEKEMKRLGKWPDESE